MSRDVGARKRGFAWFAYPDPATPGALAGDDPFGVDNPEAEPPPGTVAHWAIHEPTPGLTNRSEGRSYLILGEGAHRPKVGTGWFVEPAHLEERFELDQRGGRWVRLIRILGTRDAGDGTVQECEFEVDWT